MSHKSMIRFHFALKLEYRDMLVNNLTLVSNFSLRFLDYATFAVDSQYLPIANNALKGLEEHSSFIIQDLFI